MRVVVAGGAGFIGSHLCDYLLDRGGEVVAIDNLSTGSYDNVAHLDGNNHFELIIADITSEFTVEGPVDAVMNLASPASPVQYLARPLETLAVGSQGTKNLLELALQHDARFIQASTSEVYGDPLVHPQREDYWGHVNPIGPRSVYDESKRFAEALTMAYHRSHNLNVGIARIFNTYGPRLAVDDGRVVSNFICQALKSEPLTVFGDGSQTRSLCYVSDTTAGFTALLESKVLGPINLGNPIEIAMLNLAQEILELTNSNSEIRFVELPIDDPRRRQPDISKAQMLINWHPIVSLKNGLRATIEYFSKEIGGFKR